MLVFVLRVGAVPSVGIKRGLKEGKIPATEWKTLNGSNPISGAFQLP